MKKAISELLINLHSTHGSLTPEMVVREASSSNSPLHGLFEWNDARAAHQHRLDTARTLIREVRVKITHNQVRLDAPYFVRDPAADAKTQGYVSTLQLRSHEDLARESVLNECERAYAAFKRAQAVAAAVGVEADVLQLMSNIDELTQRMRSATGRAEAPNTPRTRGIAA